MAQLAVLLLLASTSAGWTAAAAAAAAAAGAAQQLDDPPALQGVPASQQRECGAGSNAGSSSELDSSACRSAGSTGWAQNSSHASSGCNMPVLDAEGLSVGEIVQQLAVATTPLLIRGMLHLSDWQSQASIFVNRTALVERFGREQMQLSVGTLLSNGPESTQLDRKKLEFMQQAWGAVQGSVLGDKVQQQVRTGKPRPQVELGEWLAALREGSSPPDAYVFQNVSGGPVAQALTPLHTLWRDAVYAQFAQRWRSKWRGDDPPALTRVGIGSSGSGAPFHDHDVIALNVAFVGRKRWLVTRPCRPNCRIPFREGGAAVYHPNMLLSDEERIAAALRFLGEGGDTWDCVQHPGDVVFVPEMFLHSTINLDESVAVAVQCNDGADERAGLSELNALVVHASSAAESVGPCGVAWESPFGQMSADEALAILQTLPDNFRGDPKVYLNRPMRDGRLPVDVVVRYGDVSVASVLASQGAQFLPDHLWNAEQRGHSKLAVLIRSLLKQAEMHDAISA
jgi:hypothetical protein